MRAAVQQHINDWLGTSDSLVRIRPQSGGDTSSVWWTTTSMGRELVVKTADEIPTPVFQSEREGLESIRQTKTIATPSVMTHSNDLGYMVLQAIQTEPETPSFWKRAGRELAQLHQGNVGDQYGWRADNFIGPTPQLNQWTSDWALFWRDFRLQPQRQWARDHGLLDAELETLLDALMNRVESWVCDERPCLLHGDLWSGNLLCRTGGVPVLIDPAVYLGHREADLAMTTLFGGFPSSFYTAYAEVWPLEPGWELRLPFYGLYHWLNHLNAFGATYRSACVQTMRTLLR